MPVGVDVRELERPERKLAQLLQRLGDRQAVGAHRLQQRLQTLGVHDAPSPTLAPQRPASGAEARRRQAAGSTLRMLATSVSNANGLRTSS